MALHDESQRTPSAPEPVAQARTVPGAGDPASRVLALQRTIGNRAVGRLLAREPAQGPTGEDHARAEEAIRQLEEGVVLSAADREFIYRALTAKREGRTDHSGYDMARTAFWHPVKVAEHVGPKMLISDRLAEDRYLLERFPNLWPELVGFYASSGTTPTINVVPTSDFRFEEPLVEAYNVYKYLQAKRREGEPPKRVAVTPSMFGDIPQDPEEASLLLGSFNVLAERAYLPQEPGYESGSQFKLVVTDSLGLQEGQQGYFWGLSFLVGSKNVVLAEYLGTVDAAGKVEVKPWWARYEPKEPPRCDPSGMCEQF